MRRSSDQVIFAVLIPSLGGVQNPGNASNEYDGRAQFYYAYSSLVLYSFGLENALEVSRSIVDRRSKSDDLARENGYLVLLA